MISQPRACGAGQHQQGWFDNRQPANNPQREIHRLGSLLETERARWLEENQKVAALEAELENTKSELKRQKTLKEMYINREKETKRELMRVERFTNPATLSSAAIAYKVHTKIKYKKKKMLLRDFEEVKTAHIINEEAFKSEIHTEREKNCAIQQELDQIKTCYEELRLKYEADIGGAERQVDQQLLENLRAEKDDLQKKMSKEIARLQERETNLQREMEHIRVSYQELNSRYETDVSALRRQAEAYQHQINREKEAAETANHLQRELEQAKVSQQELKAACEGEVFALRQQAEAFEKQLDKEIKAHSQKMTSDLQTINKLGAEKDALQQQLTALQQLHSGCEVSYKTELESLKAELQDRDEMLPPKRKRAMRQEPSSEKPNIPVKTLSGHEAMDLDHLLEETLSDGAEFPEVSAAEFNDFMEEMLKVSSVVDAEPVKVTDLSVETRSEKMESPDHESMEASGSKQDPSVWKKIRHSLGLRKPQKWKKTSKTTS